MDEVRLLSLSFTFLLPVPRVLWGHCKRVLIFNATLSRVHPAKAGDRETCTSHRQESEPNKGNIYIIYNKSARNPQPTLLFLLFQPRGGHASVG